MARTAGECASCAGLAATSLEDGHLQGHWKCVSLVFGSWCPLCCRTTTWTVSPKILSLRCLLASVRHADLRKYCEQLLAWTGESFDISGCRSGRGCFLVLHCSIGAIVRGRGWAGGQRRFKIGRRPGCHNHDRTWKGARHVIFRRELLSKSRVG